MGHIYELRRRQRKWTPISSAPLAGLDIRNWLPDEDWDSAAFACCRSPADGWHWVSKELHVPLNAQWQEHSTEFEITTSFNDGTILRFRLPPDAKGTFEPSTSPTHG